jgi:hypothetical protein
VRILISMIMLFVGCVNAFAQTAESVRTTGAANTNDRLRWEFVTDGSSALGDSKPDANSGNAPNLAGTDANFLFKLDYQPLLKYRGGENATRAQHGHFQVGVVSVPRAVKAKPDLGNSSAVQTLTAQGAEIRGATNATPTLSHQRAFTVGGEYSDNRLFNAQGSGVFAEFGVVARVNFDAYLEDDRFFEKDGLTYVTVPSTIGSEAGYYRFESGLRFRVTNGEMKFAGGEGGNVDDLLLFELVYKYSGATAGLVAEASTDHRYTWRFIATPRVHKPKDTEKNMVKAVLGIEFDRDLKGKGQKDIRVFYGTNVNVEALFK